MAIAIPEVRSSARLHLVGWGVACFGATIASAGMTANLRGVALAGSGVWLFAVGLHLVAILRRSFGLNTAIGQPR